MDPESQQLDRDAVAADHRAVAERIDREVEEMLAAAAAKRRAYVDESLDHLRAEVEPRPPAATDGEAAPAKGGAAGGTEGIAEILHRAAAAEAQLTQAQSGRDELEALLEISESDREQAVAELRSVSERAADLDRRLRELDAQQAAPEREQAALTEAQKRRAEVEEEAQEILIQAHSTADSVVEAITAGRRAEAEAEVAGILALAGAAADQRRNQAETEAADVVAKARAEAEQRRIEAGQRRAEAETEAAEILAQACAEADRTAAALGDERRRVRELLAGTLASLDAEAAPSSEGLMADLESRLHETSDPPPG